MKTCITCRCQENLSLRLDNYNRDERLPFIERVLGSLIESRFKYGRFESLNAFAKPRDVAEVCMDLHPKPLLALFRGFCSVLFRAFRGQFFHSAAATGASAPTGAASTLACQRLKTAYELTFTQLANARAP